MKSTRQKFATLWMALGLTVAGTQALAHSSVELSGLGGYDSNPYKLSSSLSPRSAGFIKLRALGAVKPDKLLESGLLAKGDLETHRYSSSGTDADEWTATGLLGYRLGQKFSSDSRFREEFGAGVRAARSTFVSHTTGVVATAAGQPVPDRYSYNSGSLFTNLDYFAGRSANWSLDLGYEDRNYIKDYAAFGENRLDYKEFEVAPKLRYSVTDKLQAQLGGSYKQRRYVDRRAQDPNSTPKPGARIPGTNLRYDYRQIDASVAYAVTESDKLDLGVLYTQRRDNALGYLDYDEPGVNGHYGHKFSPGQELRARVSYNDRRFRNKSAALDPTELQDRSGSVYGVSYLQPITFANIQGLTWVTELEYAKRKHTTPVFAYERFIAMTGLQKSW